MQILSCRLGTPCKNKGADNTCEMNTQKTLQNVNYQYPDNLHVYLYAPGESVSPKISPNKVGFMRYINPQKQISRVTYQSITADDSMITYLENNKYDQGDIDVGISSVPVLQYIQTGLIVRLPCFRPCDVHKQFIYCLLWGQLATTKNTVSEFIIS